MESRVATNINILSTMPLPRSVVDEAQAMGMSVDALPFIRVTEIDNPELREEIASLAPLPLTAVFTSANAVRSVAGLLDGLAPEWNIYCIGNSTLAQAILLLGSSAIIATAPDAATLAGIMLEDNVLETVFFCGDKHLDTLPAILMAADVSVHEIIVYTTMETPVTVADVYDGVLVFSPSGAHSFFSVNTVQPHTVFFAIGNTTGAAVATYTANKVIICTTPAKEAVLREAVQYFKEHVPAKSVEQ